MPTNLADVIHLGTLSKRGSTLTIQFDNGDDAERALHLLTEIDECLPAASLAAPIQTNLASVIQELRRLLKNCRPFVAEAVQLASAGYLLQERFTLLAKVDAALLANAAAENANDPTKPAPGDELRYEVNSLREILDDKRQQNRELKKQAGENAKECERLRGLLLKMHDDLVEVRQYFSRQREHCISMTEPQAAVAYLDALDRTRPVWAAMNHELRQPDTTAAAKE